MTGGPLDIAIAPSIAEAFPGYHALVVVAEGIAGGPSDAASDALVRAAEASHAGLARAAELPHVAAWRAAFSAFGAKPSKYPCSAEALIARAISERGLPRINRLVDLSRGLRPLTPSANPRLRR